LALAAEPGFLDQPRLGAREPNARTKTFFETAVRANASIKWPDEATKWEKLWKELFLPVR
jgi:hypothetical protein